MKPLLVFLLTVLLSGGASAAEFKLVRRYGHPTFNREQAWDGHINYASWADDDHIVFASNSGAITCLSVNDGKVEWSMPGSGRPKASETAVFDPSSIQGWSVSIKLHRLAYLTGDMVISIVDSQSGKSLFKADRKALAQLLGIDFALPSRLALFPNDGRLIIGTFSTQYGRNGYVLDPPYKKLSASFHVDASASELSASHDGKRVATIADDDVMCVRDLATDSDVFFRGKRIKEERDSFVFTVDAPFVSHLRDGGDDIIVYTVDNSWNTGRVYVHNLKTNSNESFDAGNGHIELDVFFPKHRIVLTGTSTDLTLLEFNGHQIAHTKGATLQRNSSVEFSPNGDRVVVASWDNTVSVFRIAE